VKPCQAQTSACPKAERNPHNKTKDMSFIIKTNASSAFTARGLQERHARDRHTEHRPNPASRCQDVLTDSGDLTHFGKSAAAIREAGDFQARLNESLSFLQTQDSALGQIQKLFVNSAKQPDFLDLFESLTGEKFNGLDLFTRHGEEQPLFVQAHEIEEAVCIHRPLINVESPSACHEAVLAAREENQKEQAKLREISESSATIHPCPDMTASKISNAQSAKESLALSQRYVLADAATALSGQANSAHETILRLFS
jgi:hypothetical protein